MKSAQTELSGLVNGGKAVAPASWSAAALCRFPSAAKKAPEGWRSPKPRGVADAGMNFRIVGAAEF
jgi:hypothetical protein